jgi:hypothetical protein
MQNYNRIEKYKNATLYYLYDKLHRIDGPAEEYVYGTQFWWIEGEQLKCKTQEEFERYIKLKLFW